MGRKLEDAAHAGKDAVDNQRMDDRVDVYRSKSTVTGCRKPADALLHQIRQEGADDAEGQPENQCHNRREAGDRRIFSSQNLIHGLAADMLPCFLSGGRP